ncbi:MAG TPA: alpha/beta hydrolase [Haloplasmataceae bacterium]
MQIYQELKTNEGVLRGYLHKPNILENVPLVVMYHGFKGSKVSNNFLFTQFSRYLCKHNIASLRFDFLGSGESDHDFSYMTFSKELNEAEEILNYAKTFPFVSKIILMGLSMGGVIATQIAKENNFDIDKLILWSPAGNINKIVELRRNDFTPLENGNFDLGGIELSPSFVEDIINHDFFNGIDNFTKPVAIFHGQNDQYVPIKVSQYYKQIYHNCQLYLYENADHTFYNVETRNILFRDNVKFILEEK